MVVAVLVAVAAIVVVAAVVVVKEVVVELVVVILVEVVVLAALGLAVVIIAILLVGSSGSGSFGPLIIERRAIEIKHSGDDAQPSHCHTQVVVKGAIAQTQRCSRKSRDHRIRSSKW